jgi:hypothetical protein
MHSAMRQFGLVLLVGVVLLGVGAGAVWAWMRAHPIDVTALAPRLEAAIAAEVPGLSVQFGPLSAVRDPLRRRLEVTATAVRVRHPTLDGPATIGRLRITVNQAALVGAPPILSSVLIDDVTARLPWSWADVQAALAAPGDTPPPRLPWLQGLDRVVVHNISLLVPERDRATDHRIVLDSLRLETPRLRPRHVAGSAALLVSGGGQTVPVAVTLEGTAGGAWASTVQLSPQSLQALPEWLPWIADLPQLSASVVATIRVSADTDWQASTDVSVTEGSLSAPALWRQPLRLRGATLRAAWQPQARQLQLSDVTLLAEGTRLRLGGTIGLGPQPSLALTGGFERMSVGDLTTLWPIGPSPSGRAWIAENIVTGGIRDGVLSVQQAPGAPEPRVDLGFRFDDLTVHYRRPMPPLLDADGTGRLTNEGLTLRLASGSLNGLTVTPATVRIEPFDRSPTLALITMPITGSLTRLLQVLDSEPLGFITRYERDPDAITGRVAGTLNLTIPLLKSVRMDDILFKASARVRQARIPEVYGPRALTAADLDLTILPESLTARGTGVLGAQPIGLTWSEDFTGRSASPTRYALTANTSMAALVALGVDLTTIADGPARVALTLEGRGGDVRAGQFQADLTATRITLPLFGVAKVARAPGQARGRMTFRDGWITLDDVTVRSAGLTADGRVRAPLADGRSRITLDQISIGGTRLAGTIDVGAGQPVVIDARAPSIDLRGPLASLTQRAPAPAAPPPAASEPTTVPVIVSARIGSAQLLGEVMASDLSATATVTGETLTRLAVAGYLNGNTRALTKLDIVPTGGGRRLIIDAPDAGQLGRAFDLFQHGEGGRLSVDAALTGVGPLLEISGKARMTDFRVAQVPALARALTLASLTGLRDTLSGRGIEFRTVEAPFTLRRGIVEVRRASAIGPGLGLTLEGQVDRANLRTNLKGVIVPSYTLNAAVGRIPLVGPLITGGRNQGLIGFNYRIEGTLANPDVQVNAASGLAPGFLRRLFAGGPATVPAAEPQPADSNP